MNYLILSFIIFLQTVFVFDLQQRSDTQWRTKKTTLLSYTGQSDSSPVIMRESRISNRYKRYLLTVVSYEFRRDKCIITTRVGGPYFLRIYSLKIF